MAEYFIVDNAPSGEITSRPWGTNGEIVLLGVTDSGEFLRAFLLPGGSGVFVAGRKEEIVPRDRVIQTSTKYIGPDANNIPVCTVIGEDGIPLRRSVRYQQTNP